MELIHCLCGMIATTKLPSAANIHITPVPCAVGILYHENMVDHVDTCYFGITITDTPAKGTYMNAKAS